MKKEINPALLPPKEKLDFIVSIRITRSQKEKIESICSRYKVQKNDFFRFMLKDIFNRYKLPENGTRN